MQADFNALLAATRKRIAAHVAALAAGSLDVPSFADAMAATLEVAHTRATVLGRHLAGDVTPEERDDRRFAEIVMDGEAEYLDHFASDLASGRYTGKDGSLRAGAVEARAQMYGAQILRTANEAWSLTLPEETLFFWILGAEDGSNCAECPQRAANGPYTYRTLPLWGTATCLHNCRCRIETQGGESGFTLPE